VTRRRDNARRAYLPPPRRHPTGNVCADRRHGRRGGCRRRCPAASVAARHGGRVWDAHRDRRDAVFRGWGVRGVSAVGRWGGRHAHCQRYDCESV